MRHRPAQPAGGRGRLVEQKEQGLWDPENLLPGKKHIYRMGMEDFYVHSLLHFRKHFTGSGVGIRFLADIYVFRQQRLPLDAARIRSQLEAVHMTAFARQMERIANACFDGTGTPALDRDAALVVNYLVSAGVHGGREVQRALQVQQRGQGTYLHNMPREMLRQCFPSAEVLHKRYPPSGKGALAAARLLGRPGRPDRGTGAV